MDSKLFEVSIKLQELSRTLREWLKHAGVPLANGTLREDSRHWRELSNRLRERATVMRQAAEEMLAAKDGAVSRARSTTKPEVDDPKAPRS
jgi:hypothetical protein